VERSFADNPHSTAMGTVSNIFWDLRESRSQPFHARISMRLSRECDADSRSGCVRLCRRRAD
jgi:hypothetical protein